MKGKGEPRMHREGGGRSREGRGSWVRTGQEGQVYICEGEGEPSMHRGRRVRSREVREGRASIHL